VEFYSKTISINIFLLFQTQIFVSFLFRHLIITEERELIYSDLSTIACLQWALTCQEKPVVCKLQWRTNHLQKVSQSTLSVNGGNGLGTVRILIFQISVYCKQPWDGYVG